MRKIYLIIFIILLVVSAFAVIQQDWSKVTLEAVQVKGPIYNIDGTGGNIGVSVGDDGVVIIDTKFEPLADKIKAAIESIGGGTPKYILNTHVHGDHTGGNAVFSQSGTVIAQTNVRKRLADDPEKAAKLPVITFDSSLSLYMNGEELRVKHYPKSHTDGDAVIYFTGSDVVHMGDMFFNGLFPYVDLGNGGTVQHLTENVKSIYAEISGSTKIIPGHGPVAGKADLQKYIRMLDETTALVKEKMQSGKTLEQIKAEGLPEEWSAWNWSFISTDKWLDTIHKSYSAAN